ncbi:36611_t:CDS:2 [Gigaspora margarita]|uniref:36611_t:CDS:1 n=1 Tax=Gigaspora margarita TaxID=4874 RepID=A0ABN7VL51_GIGMA|nr:36611_t:CDS:2 [Gigaspora margarita]
MRKFPTSSEKKSKSKKSQSSSHIRVVVAIDFGTTNSGFASAHKESPEKGEIYTAWPGNKPDHKTPTALQYDSKYKKVTAWGIKALVEFQEDAESSDDDDSQLSRPVELFKLHLSDLKDEDKPWLPPELDYKQAIKDYLTGMRKLVEERLSSRWSSVKFPSQVKIVLTIPAEWPPDTTEIMRKCAHEAGLLNKLSSNNLEFTTEPEAAALYCLSVVKEHNLKPGDCGGGTVDITIRKLLENNGLGEITERIGYPCGSTFVDKEFLKFVGEKVGMHALSKFKKNHYKQIQYLVQEFFCRKIKIHFNGKQSEWKIKKLNLLNYCKNLQGYVTGDRKTEMENAGWIIKIDFTSVKEMFDPVVNKILELISDQLKASKEKCSAMFLVGGFAESVYLLNKVKETFRFQVEDICVPTSPKTAVVQGGLYYGLNINTVKTRVLKWSFGIEAANEWVSGNDEERRSPKGLIYTFECLAKRGSQVDVNKPFSKIFHPARADQKAVAFKIFYTASVDGKYCDDPGMNYIKTLHINLKNVQFFGRDRPIEFKLTFGQLESKASAYNNITGKLIKEIYFDRKD